MTGFDLFTIGHSNIPAVRFIGMLRETSVETLVDVRSIPVSRFCPWFSAKNLAPLLAAANINYLFLGEELGGRPRDPSLYCDGTADYDAMARRPRFQAALDHLLADGGLRRPCLMCSERDPLACHRCLLVGRALAARGATIGHILHDGTIEAHTRTERRLLEVAGADNDLFATGQDERLAAAYRHRARALAYRVGGTNKAKNRATNLPNKSR